MLNQVDPIARQELGVTFAAPLALPPFCSASLRKPIVALMSAFGVLTSVAAHRVFAVAFTAAGARSLEAPDR